MMKEQIGYNAGAVWMLLVKGEVEAKTLKKESKLTEKDMYLSLGWLAREGKIQFREEGKELFVSLL